MKIDMGTLIKKCPGTAAAWQNLGELFADAITHTGFAEIHIRVRWLSKGRKELILGAGKEYRYVISNLPAGSIDISDESEKGGA